MGTGSGAAPGGGEASHSEPSGRARSDSGDDSPDHFKLADFGFAKHVDDDDAFRNPAGTLGYAAPEVLGERQYGPACDVWSAGVVLYIMLAGHPPFPTKDDVDTANLNTDELLELE